MNLWNGFLDVCTWTYGATRAPGARSRPRVHSRAYWAENWELTKKYPWSSAAMWCILAALLAIGAMEVIGPTPPLQEGATEFRWKLFGMGTGMLLALPLLGVSMVRMARDRRESGDWVAARSRARAAVGVLSIAALGMGLGIGMTIAALPVPLLPAVAAGFVVSVTGVTLLFAELLMDGCSRVWPWWRRRTDGDESGETRQAGV